MRDKLIKLIYEAFQPCEMYRAMLIADHLIANGVTVQKWIPVTEGLPEAGEPVLAKYLSFIDDSADPAQVLVAVLLHGKWYQWEGALADCYYKLDCDITHWLPLSVLPKEV